MDRIEWFNCGWWGLAEEVRKDHQIALLPLTGSLIDGMGAMQGLLIVSGCSLSQADLGGKPLRRMLSIY